MYKNYYSELIKLAGRIDMLVIRLVAVSYLQLGMLSLLWFVDYNFFKKYLFDTAIAAIPLLSLFVGIVTPEKWLQSKPYFVMYQVAILIGVPCVAISMVQSLTTQDGPDYAIFSLQLILLLVLFIFILRSIFAIDQSTGSDSIDPKNPFL